MVHQLGVSLEDLYNGITRKLALQKNVICAKCEGKKKVVVSNPSSSSFMCVCVDYLGLRKKKSESFLAFLSLFFA